jgi:hypothetical protein
MVGNSFESARSAGTRDRYPNDLGLCSEESAAQTATGATGAITLIQRFGSVLALNIHFHMLVLDGAYLVENEPRVLAGSRVPTWRSTGARERLAERIGRPLAPRWDDLLCHSIRTRWFAILIFRA